MQQAYLKASNTGPLDYFGISAAASGNTVVVGAFNEDSSSIGVNSGGADDSAMDAGAAYVYVRNGTNWSQQAFLKPSDTTPNGWFGISAAISGDTIVIGASQKSFLAGAAYVFVRNGINWTQQARLSPSNADWGDRFGIRVAISGDTIVVGAYREQSNSRVVNADQSDNSATNAGAAYVFVREGTNWIQQAYLKASNASADDLFGRAVSISGNTIIVGAEGESSNATGVNGNQSNEGATNSGAVYVFVREGSNWVQQAYLKASNAASNSYFGYAVGVSGDTVIVGAYGESSSAVGINGTNRFPFPRTDAGAAYVFVRQGTNWSQQAFVKGTDTDGGNYFGWAVGISGETAVVTTRFTDTAYIFVRQGTNWSERARPRGANTGSGDAFGFSAAIGGDIAVFGAIYEDSSATGVNGNSNDDNGWESGAAYIFTGVTERPQLSIVREANGHTIQFRGAPGVHYRLEQATNVLGPWLTNSVTQATESGIGAFQITDAPAGTGFYRTVQQ